MLCSYLSLCANWRILPIFAAKVILFFYIRKFFYKKCSRACVYEIFFVLLQPVFNLPEKVKEADTSNIHLPDAVGKYQVEFGVYKRKSR